MSVDGNVISETINEIKKAESSTCPMTFDSIYEFAKAGDISGILPSIKQQVEYNTAISNEGLSNDYGANIGRLLLLDDETPSLETKCKARAAAGSDARMSVACSYLLRLWQPRIDRIYAYHYNRGGAW